jgi:UDP-glucose 4-epimerase
MPESQALEQTMRPSHAFGKILVTGGAGYIGTHVCLALLRAGAEVIVIDNFSNASPKALDRVQDIAGRSIVVVQADICDPVVTGACFAGHRPDAVIHLAGLKSVNASIEQPLEYYRTNVEGTLNLLRQMSLHGCRSLVFSSSATVYGEAVYLPYDEAHPVAPVNPYGRTKLFAEQAIRDWAASFSGCGAVILRYFNPVGADASGRIGEEPRGIPDNLMPYIAQVATGRLPVLRVFGTDYPTRDGTAERDYIHVSDLADAHLSAVNFSMNFTGSEIFNVGTGRGHTVLELLHEYQLANACKIPHVMNLRRPGDVACSVAAVEKAESALAWKAKRPIDEVCTSAHAWQLGNPNGYVE